MLLKFFNRGIGGGTGPVEYITRKDNPLTKQLRYPLPQVIRGNPQTTVELIDSLNFKHKYRSGVLSFAPSDAPTDQQIEAVIDDFERYAFAGLNEDAYHTLWVKHTHTGNNRVELHFVTPRVELTTGKSLNIAPPGWHGYFKPWQSFWNISQSWARPDDPDRKRDLEPGFQGLINNSRKARGLEPITDTKQLLTEIVKERITAGLIHHRDDIIDLFQQELGLTITRAGSDYLTVADPKTKKRYRLKGKLYEREFRPQRQATAEADCRERVNSTANTRELLAVKARIDRNYQYRYQYNQTRYGASKSSFDLGSRKTLFAARPRRVEPLNRYLLRQLGTDAILERSDIGESKDIGFDNPTNQFSVSGIETAGRDVKVAEGADRGDRHHSDRQRNISDSADRLYPHSWLAMPGSTLSEIGVDDERTRKKINRELQFSSQAVQTGYDELIHFVQRGHESALSAEQAATESSNRLTKTGAELERANKELQQQQQRVNFYVEGVRRGRSKKRLKDTLLSRYIPEDKWQNGNELLINQQKEQRKVKRYSSRQKDDGLSL